MQYLSLVVVLAAACFTGCDSRTDAAVAEEPLDRASLPPDQICEVAEAGMALPDEVRETSGVARSARDPDLFWTHNDAGNDPDLFAFDGDGRLVQRVRVSGADLVDWEDLEAAPCGDRTCLYVGDIGDNDGDREWVTIYRVEEPAAGVTESARAAPLHARFPDGPRDAETLFAGESGDLYVVTKGRRKAIALYRYPAPQRPGEVVTLEHVRELFPAPGSDDDRVTAGTSTPDGRWVGIRTYRALYLYPPDSLLGDGAGQPIMVDLSSLSEPQGESLTMADDGTVWVSSEADGDRGPTWSRLHCVFPER